MITRPSLDKMRSGCVWAPSYSHCEETIPLISETLSQVEHTGVLCRLRWLGLGKGRGHSDMHLSQLSFTHTPEAEPKHGEQTRSEMDRG